MNFLLANKKSIFFILLAIIGTIVLMQEKYYANDLYKKYLTQTNLEMQEFDFNEKLKGIAYSYAQDNNISDTYKNTLYDCLGYAIYNTDSSQHIKDTLAECKKDYITQNAKAIYYNQAWLMRDFSKWDGSYILLERIIKKHVKEKASYKMTRISHAMFFEDKRPYMFVSIEYRAANLGGRISDREMSVKVDAKTKELFDLR
jgi:hypothetical protein